MQYDRNAIKVENVQNDQIGHIPRTLASKLAPFMDRRALLVEGTLSGNMGTYDCPILLKLFGTSDPIERANLRSQMKAYHLSTEVLDAKEKVAKKRKAEELKRAAAAKRMKGAHGRAGGGQHLSQSSQSSQMDFGGALSQGDEPSSQSMDDLMEVSQRFNPREIGEVAEKFGASEEILAQMPLADCPKALSTRLLPYQRQALAWLLEKENPQLPPEGSDDAVQLWKRSSKGRNVFTNIVSTFPAPLLCFFPCMLAVRYYKNKIAFSMQSLRIVVDSTRRLERSRLLLIIIVVFSSLLPNWKHRIDDRADLYIFVGYELLYSRPRTCPCKWRYIV